MANRQPGAGEKRCYHCMAIYPSSTVFSVAPFRKQNKLTCCQACAATYAAPQADAFTPEANYKADGPSRQAARGAATAAKLGDTHRKIWAALREKPMTVDEISGVTGISPFTVRPRTSDLKNAGWVIDAGETRAGDSGKPMTVWAAVSKEAQAA